MSQLTQAQMQSLFEEVKNWGKWGAEDQRGALNYITLWPMPIHRCGIVAMELHLLDNLRLDVLMAACAERQRWEFFFVIAPLRVARGTGSPVNPIAFFLATAWVGVNVHHDVRRVSASNHHWSPRHTESHAPRT